jgi:hypothetical protein
MNRNRIRRLADARFPLSATALAIVGAHVACGGAGDAAPAPTTEPASVSIQAYSGTTRALAGTAVGTLVAEKLVLTAGHICAGKSSWTISTREGVTATGVRGMTYDWRDYRSNRSQPQRSDVCVIELDQAITLPAYPTIAREPVADSTRLSRTRRQASGASFSMTDFGAVAGAVSSAANKGFKQNYVTDIDSNERVDTGGAVADASTRTIYGVVSGKGDTTGALYVARTDDAIGAGWVSQHVRHAKNGSAPLPASYCWGDSCGDVPSPGPGIPDGEEPTPTVPGPGFPGAGGGAGGLPGGTLECYYPAGGGANGTPAATAEYVLETFNGSQTVHLRLTFNPDFVDNTYGANAIGWVKKGHTFKDLVGSDHAELSLLDKAGAERLHFKLDYISPSSAAPSGYASLGVRGGDGKMILGDASLVVDAKTSLERNLNERGYGTLIVDSPATTATYAPPAAAPLWDFRVVYEAWVQTAAFGAPGFGAARMTFVHASPSKGTTDTLNVDEGTCPPPWNGGGSGGGGSGAAAGPSGGPKGPIPPDGGGGTYDGSDSCEGVQCGGCAGTTCQDETFDFGDCQCTTTSSVPR